MHHRHLIWSFALLAGCAPSDGPDPPLRLSTCTPQVQSRLYFGWG